MEQPDLLCTALALNIELLSNIMCAVYRRHIIIRYYRACGTYQDFLDRGFVLTRKLLKHGFFLGQLKSHFESLTVATMTCLTAME